MKQEENKKETHEHCEVFQCKSPAYVKVREGFTEYLCCNVHLQGKDMNKLRSIVDTKETGR